jgi:hypothetical protein
LIKVRVDDIPDLLTRERGLGQLGIHDHLVDGVRAVFDQCLDEWVDVGLGHPVSFGLCRIPDHLDAN